MGRLRPGDRGLELGDRERPAERAERAIQGAAGKRLPIVNLVQRNRLQRSIRKLRRLLAKALIDAIAHQAASAKLPEVIDFYLRAVSRSRKISSARLSALSPK